MQAQYIVKKISSILHAWDPIGHTPRDEYDDLSMRLFGKLEKGYAKEQLVDFVDDYLKNFVGLSDVARQDIYSVITAITNEYDTFKRAES